MGLLIQGRLGKLRWRHQRPTKEDFIYRRVPFADKNFVRPDGSLTSACYELKKDKQTGRLDKGVSVDLCRLTGWEGSITRNRGNLKSHRLLRVSIKDINASEYDLGYLDDRLWSNRAHGLIIGEKLAKSPARKFLCSKSLKVAAPRYWGEPSCHA